MYAQDPSAYQALLHKAPWRQDPRYFQRVCISVMALLKMVPVSYTHLTLPTKA
mgnify:CR=1 FL=1